jgi:hypothetical protein
MEIRVDPKQIAIAFLWVVAVLTVINSVLLFFYYYLDDDDLFGLIDLFDFAIEGNIPTLYSAVAILFCSVLLALITYTNWHKPEGKRFYWLGLTMLFLFLAIDEGVAIHEAIGSYFERYLHAEGFIYFMWVVPYGIAVVVIGLIFLKFVRELPKTTRARFIAAGVIYLIGVLGIEMLGAREADLHSTYTVLYSMLYMLEELLEMLGIILFIYALLSHLTEETGPLSIVLQPADGNRSGAGADDDAHNRQP